MTQIWCNGRWLSPANFPLSPLDRGGLLGLGLFETILAFNGRPIFVERHLARLQKGCERLGWEFLLDDFRGIAAEILHANHLMSSRARLRLAVTAGSGPFDDLASGADRLVWLAALPASETLPGISAMVSPWARNQHSPLAGLKCASYAENLVALDHARRQGFQETLFFNTAGELCEAATANVFIVRDGVLLTPALDSGCLPGIAREVVCELAARTEIPLLEQKLFAKDLEAADEVFLTSSIHGPVAVTRLGARGVSCGPITARLQALWVEEILSDGSR